MPEPCFPETPGGINPLPPGPDVPAPAKGAVPRGRAPEQPGGDATPPRRQALTPPRQAPPSGSSAAEDAGTRAQAPRPRAEEAVPPGGDRGAAPGRQTVPVRRPARGTPSAAGVAAGGGTGPAASSPAAGPVQAPVPGAGTGAPGAGEDAGGAGLTQTEIAVKLGTSQKLIWKLMRNHGIPARRRVKRDQRGENNSSWRGDGAGYAALHKRVEASRGTPQRCDQCGNDKPGRYEWANLTGHYEDINDYARLCLPCHRGLDADRRRITGRSTSPKGGGALCPRI